MVKEPYYPNLGVLASLPLALILWTSAELCI